MKKMLVPARAVREGDVLPTHPGRVVKRVDALPGKAVGIVFDNGERHVTQITTRVVVERE